MEDRDAELIRVKKLLSITLRIISYSDFYDEDNVKRKIQHIRDLNYVIENAKSEDFNIPE